MFTQSTFAPVGAHSSDTPSVYSYKTDDDIATVMVAGYFTDKAAQLKAGEYILITCSDRSGMYEIDDDSSSVKIIGPDSGFYDYENTLTAQTITGNSVYQKLLNNGLGTHTKKQFRPRGLDLAGVWNTTTSQFDFSQLSLGDQLWIRVDLTITPSTPNQDIDIAINFDIGGESFLLMVDHLIPKRTDDIGRHISYVGMYMGTQDVIDNPAELLMRSDDTTTVLVHGWYINITRR